jgi:cholinesterase
VTNAQNFSLAFNTELATQLGSVSSHFPDAHISQFDTYSFVNGVIQNPGNFGFTDVQHSCLDGSTPCVNPDNHLFWDSFHPTTKADAIIGSAFASAVPEPEMAVMYVIGLMILGMAGSRRRKFEQI